MLHLKKRTDLYLRTALALLLSMTVTSFVIAGSRHHHVDQVEPLPHSCSPESDKLPSDHEGSTERTLHSLCYICIAINSLAMEWSPILNIPSFEQPNVLWSGQTVQPQSLFGRCFAPLRAPPAQFS